MFANFNKAFKDKSIKEKKVPDAILNYLSSTTPKGTKYISDENGNLNLVADCGRISIGGFHPKITDDMKKVLGENYTMDMIHQYAYNSQTEIELILDKDGFILINGEEVAIQDLQYNFFHPIKYTNSSWFVKTDEFPDPVDMIISSDKYSRILKIKRIPYASLTQKKYKSEYDQPLQIEFSIDEIKKENKFSISYNLKKASTTKDVVETISIFNAFVDGKGYLMGNLVSIDVEKVDKNIRIENT